MQSNAVSPLEKKPTQIQAHKKTQHTNRMFNIIG